MPTSGTILDSAERLLDYHRLSKLCESSRPIPIDLAGRPDPHRVFPNTPKIRLPSTLLDVSGAVAPLLLRGLETVPASQHSPPQDLKTLATWLHLAAGIRQPHAFDWGTDFLRAIPSPDGIHSGEVYVAAFAIDGLEPGLYHFSAREFSLQKIRGGVETLSLLRRGRPDLQFLATAPAALLISSVFCRSGWRYGRRAYRQAVFESGELLCNAHAVATGLGMTTLTRLRMNDSAMRELIGLTEDFDYAAAEAVQAMIVWADEAAHPMEVGNVAPIPTLHGVPRPVQHVVTYGSVLAAHQDVVSRVIGQREIRPPLTELTPVPLGVATESMALSDAEPEGQSLRSVLTHVSPTTAFAKSPIGRSELSQIASSAFRGGTFLPMRPEGPHPGLVRPLWILNSVAGQESGIWWHDAATNRWAMLNKGLYREIAAKLLCGREWLENAGAICVMVANLRKVMVGAGPDGYRLAFLEAGLVAQRMHLAAASLNLGTITFGDFYDDAWRQFLGLTNTGWEPLAITAIGTKIRPKN